MMNGLLLVEKKASLFFVCVILSPPGHYNDVTGGQRGSEVFFFLIESDVN